MESDGPINSRTNVITVKQNDDYSKTKHDQQVSNFSGPQNHSAAHYSIPYQALPPGLSGGYEFTFLTSYQMARMLPTGGYI